VGSFLGIIIQTQRLTDIERGYLSGLFDAEGTFILGKNKKQTKNRPFQWVISGAIRNTNLDAILYSKYLIKKILPKAKMSISVSKDSKHTIYSLVLSGFTLQEILSEIAQTLIVKSERAQLLKVAILMLRVYPRGRKNYNKNDGKIEEIYLKIRQLNKNGENKEKTKPISITFEEMRGYFAGFMDGEGTLTLSKRARPTKTRSFSWYVHGQVCNTNKKSIIAIQNFMQKFSPEFVRTINVSKRNRKKPLYTIQFERKAVEIIIYEIGKYLVIKKRHAQFLMKALPLITQNHHYWSQHIDDELEQIYLEIRKINLGAKLKTAHISEKTPEQIANSLHYIKRNDNQFGIPTNTKEGKNAYSRALHKKSLFLKS
jgi:hypothetical protein